MCAFVRMRILHWLVQMEQEKTTLIKLLCGLYQPTEGEILINGISMRDLDLENYYMQISAVFQEYMVLPTNVLCNITLRETNDELKEWEKELGVALNKEATILSGGQKQKDAVSTGVIQEGVITDLG